MELTAKHHRQVHYLLLLINIIGLTLLSIAIVVTYLNQPSTTVVKTPPVCPTFEPTKFHLDSSGFFTNAPYIVEILDDEHDGTIECIGVLINQNSVLTSRRCFDKVLDEASKERSMRPSARHRKITTGETVTILVVEKKYPKTYRPDTAFHDNLVMLHLALPFDDVVTFVNLKDDYGSGECNNLETHNLTLVEYHPIWSQRVVTVVEQTDCKAAWPDKEISDNEFCVIDKSKIIFLFVTFVI